MQINCTILLLAKEKSSNTCLNTDSAVKPDSQIKPMLGGRFVHRAKKGDLLYFKTMCIFIAYYTHFGEKDNANKYSY